MKSSGGLYSDGGMMCILFVMMCVDLDVVSGCMTGKLNPTNLNHNLYKDLNRIAS